MGLEKRVRQEDLNVRRHEDRTTSRVIHEPTAGQALGRQTYERPATEPERAVPLLFQRLQCPVEGSPKRLRTEPIELPYGDVSANPRPGTEASGRAAGQRARVRWLVVRKSAAREPGPPWVRV